MIIEAFLKKRVAGDNPWGEGATTLEWQLSSPPPYHQWETLPVIKWQRPLTLKPPGMFVRRHFSRTGGKQGLVPQWQ